MSRVVIEEAREILKDFSIEKVLFELGNGLYREATPKEVVDDVVPSNILQIYRLRKDGTWELFFIDPLGR